VNLRQLRTLCEVVDRGLRVTDAAHATHRSQSSVTRQVQLLEEELGLELFARNRNRLLRLTPNGEEILGIARRMLQDAENMRRIGQNAAHDDHGLFTIATTNFQAKYVLPSPVQQFVEHYPGVQLSMRQGTPGECCDLVTLGKADVAICAASDIPDGLVDLPCYRLYRSIITPPRHPLLRAKRLTLEELVRYPLITYDEAFNGSTVVLKAFSDRGLKPKVVLSAVDADVARIYVAKGLGIAISANIAFDQNENPNLRQIDARHLFKPSYLSLILRRHSHLRTFMIHFMKMFAPKLDREVILAALYGKSGTPIPRATLPIL